MTTQAYQTGDPAAVKPMQPNALTILPPEIQLQIADHLGYGDLCNLRKVCRSLRNPSTDPTPRLVRELSRAWREIGEVFKGDYLNVVYGWRSKARVVQQVRVYAMVRGFSNIVVKWLMDPTKYYLPCSSCRNIEPVKHFNYWSYQPAVCAPHRAGHSVQHREDFFKSLVCGECKLTADAGLYQTIGLPDDEIYMINCPHCGLTKRSSQRPMPASRYAGVCENCFKEIHHGWFAFKDFLQTVLRRMEHRESGTAPVGSPAEWEGLPECPVALDFITDLSRSDYQPLNTSFEMRAEARRKEKHVQKQLKDSQEGWSRRLAPLTENEKKDLHDCASMVFTAVCFWGLYKLAVVVFRCLFV